MIRRTARAEPNSFDFVFMEFFFTCCSAPPQWLGPFIFIVVMMSLDISNTFSWKNKAWNYLIKFSWKHWTFFDKNLFLKIIVVVFTRHLLDLFLFYFGNVKKRSMWIGEFIAFTWIIIFIFLHVQKLDLHLRLGDVV